MRKQRSDIGKPRPHIKLAKSQWKLNPGEDLRERLRQFEAICAFKQKLSRYEAMAHGNKCHSFPVIGEMFGLSPKEINYCSHRAWFFLEEVRNLTRIRARRGLPIDSDAMIAATKDRPHTWEYLDKAA